MATRKVIKSDKIGSHRNPIPAAVVIGNIILPSVIGGQGPGGTSDDPEEQIRQAFENMKNVMEAAGGTTDNIGKVTVYLKDFGHRELVNKEWLKMFPKGDDRPARHVMKLDVQGKTVIQLDVIGVL
jgi:2-iminobutanoate/2-iminopropanoate deaminase